MNRSVRKPLLLLLLVAMLGMLAGGSAYAFSDIGGEPGESAIMQLKEKGVVQGDKNNNLFHPRAEINVATAVALIVKGLDLNIDNIRFIKKPEASDYFTKAKDGVWYSDYFIIAQFNGLGLPQDVDPAAKVTREQFALWLFGALSHKGDYAWIEIYMLLNDEDQVSAGYMDSIQKLLIAKIAEVDAKQNFRPQANITKADAAVWVARTADFIARTPPIVIDEPIASDVSIKTEAVNDDIAKVTLTATLPHSGYGFEISGIAFEGDRATINYAVTKPNPEMMYPQALVTVEAVAYVSSRYEAEIGSFENREFPGSIEGSSSDGSAGGGASGSTGIAS